MLAETPYWALTLAYWLHMVATVVWIGGLAALGLFVLPAAQARLSAEEFATLLLALQRRFDPLAWFSVVALAGSGLFQMSASPHYEGFLAVHNRWAVAILLKHLVFLAMTALSAYLTWGVMPRLRRLAFERARATFVEVEKERALAAREVRLLRANLWLGVLVLGLTALARAS